MLRSSCTNRSFPFFGIDPSVILTLLAAAIVGFSVISLMIFQVAPHSCIRSANSRAYAVLLRKPTDHWCMQRKLSFVVVSEALCRPQVVIVYRQLLLFLARPSAVKFCCLPNLSVSSLVGCQGFVRALSVRHYSERRSFLAKYIEKVLNYL